MSSKQPIFCWFHKDLQLLAVHSFAKLGILLVLQVLQDDATCSPGPQSLMQCLMVKVAEC